MAIYPRAFHHIGSELDVMREYVLTMRNALRQAHKTLHSDVGKMVVGMSEEESQEVFNDYADDDIFLGDYFPALSSSWTFVSIYSFLEHQLVYICRAVKEAKGEKTNFQPRVRVLDKCKEQLKTLEIAVPTDGQEWQELKIFQEIRNTIVHRLGEVEENTPRGRNESVYNYVQKRTDITIDYLKIISTDDFCLHVIEAVRDFLDRIIALVPKELYSKSVRER